MSLSTLIFLSSLGFVVYVLGGYPLLLAVYARLFPKPIHKRTANMRLSVVIPVRNGARWIRAKLASMLDADYPPDLIDILIVSDGSTDETEDIVRGFGDPRVRLLPLPGGGKATAVSRGIENVSGDIIVLTDVRQEFDRQALSKLVACFADTSVGVVTGELIIREGVSREEYNTGLYWKYEKWIRKNLNRVDAMLGASGSIYAIRKELVAPIPAEILLDDVYLPFTAVSKGFRIYFECEAKAYDLPTSLHSEFLRKVRTQAGVYQIIGRFPALLWPGNRRFIHFASHKLGRLLAPFAVLAVAVSSFGLLEPWRAIALSTQALFYSLALVDVFVSEQSGLKNFTAVIRTFVVLVSATLCAIAVWFVPARRLWKETRVGAVPRSDRIGSSGQPGPVNVE